MKAGPHSGEHWDRLGGHSPAWTSIYRSTPEEKTRESLCILTVIQYQCHALISLEGRFHLSSRRKIKMKLHYEKVTHDNVYKTGKIPLPETVI